MTLRRVLVSVLVITSGLADLSRWGGDNRSNFGCNFRLSHRLTSKVPITFMIIGCFQWKSELKKHLILS